MSDPETKVTRLSNGLTVASQDNKDFPTCTVSVTLYLITSTTLIMTGWTMD